MYALFFLAEQMFIIKEHLPKLNKNIIDNLY